MENIINTYRNGKIYKIFNNIDNSCSVGSTIKELNIRMAEHIEQYKLWIKSTAIKTQASVILIMALAILMITTATRFLRIITSQ